MATSVYIVPAMTDQAGQCRIVARDGNVHSARDDYRRNPQDWKEIGIMNSQGRLVCLEADNLAAYDELKACEPLMAGLHIVVDEQQAIAA